MKKLFVFASIAALIVAGTACRVRQLTWTDAETKAVTNIAQMVEIPAGLNALEVENASGSVRINGNDTVPSHGSWKLSVRARTAAIARQIAAGVKCKTELVDGRLKLVVSAPNIPEPHAIQSDFEIVLPKSVSLQTKTSFGATDIADLTSDVDAAGQNGPMELHHIGGHLRAQTTFARLAVSDTGPAVLKNQNGEIEATRVNGPLDARTSFASLVARNIGGPASLANQNGDIQGAAIRGRMNATTSFGRIVARDIAGAVRLRDQNGNVQVVRAMGDADVKTSFDKLSVEEIGGDAILVNQNGAVAARGVTGSVDANTSFAPMEINGSGAEFVCHNQNGAIRLRATSASLTHIQAMTSFGALELHLPADVKPAILAQTSFGDVESDFPVLRKARGADALLEAASTRATLENQNGNIRVYRD